MICNFEYPDGLNVLPTIVKTTPKKFAQDQLFQAILVGVDYWKEHNESAVELMTEREKLLIQEQLEKISDRLFGHLGFMPFWEVQKEGKK